MSRRAGHRRPIDADRFVVQAAVQRVGHFRGVDHDGAVEVKWSDMVSDDFAHNFIRCRVEGRFGVSVNQPGAVVKVATAARTGHVWPDRSHIGPGGAAAAIVSAVDDPAISVRALRATDGVAAGRRRDPVPRPLLGAGSCTSTRVRCRRA